MGELQNLRGSFTEYISYHLGNDFTSKPLVKLGPGLYIYIIHLYQLPVTGEWRCGQGTHQCADQRGSRREPIAAALSQLRRGSLPQSWGAHQCGQHASSSW
jgi:hypothetical protein